MDASLVEALIPIVIVLIVFSFPVALVAAFKFFKLKEKELQIDAELRRTAGNALEQRVQRLESIILALDSDVRAKLGTQRELMEPPPAAQESGQAQPAITRVK